MRKIGGLFFCCILLIALAGCSFGNNMTKKETVKKETEMETKKITEKVEKAKEKKKLIAIDAGHQQEQNSELEPIGPGAETKKMKVASGTQGIESGTPEYKVNLAVSKKLQQRLQEEGYQVLMIRETNDVNLSNRERARIANEAKADIFIRIHCNSAEDPTVHGALTLCPDADNPFCEEKMIKESSRLSELVLEDLCQNTGAKKLSIIRSSDMSGINWCEVPVTIVEMGFMSNPQEDEKLNEEGYQMQLTEGMVNGIKAYFNEREEE